MSSSPSIRKLKDKKHFIIQKINMINHIILLKKELNRLEWYHQTTPLSAKEEDETIKRIKEISLEISTLSKELGSFSTEELIKQKALLIAESIEIEKEIEKLREQKREQKREIEKRFRRGEKVSFSELQLLYNS
jgi:uncharacterized coiled-coil DUF342 family protein